MAEWIWIAGNGVVGLPLAALAVMVVREFVRAGVAPLLGFRVFEIRLGAGVRRLDRAIGPIDLVLGGWPIAGATVARSGTPRRHRIGRVTLALAPALAQSAWLLGRIATGTPPGASPFFGGPAPLACLDLANALLLVGHTTFAIELPGGKSVPLGSLLTLREERPLRELLRNNQRRMVTLSAEIAGGRSLDEVWRDVHAVTGAMELPEGVQLIEAGEQEAMRDSFRDLGWAMLLAVLLVYMILAAQFESFLDPLLIAAVLPIGLAGSAIAIGVTGNTVNILSLIGVLALLLPVVQPPKASTGCVWKGSTSSDES